MTKNQKIVNWLRESMDQHARTSGIPTGKQGFAAWVKGTNAIAENDAESCKEVMAFILDKSDELLQIGKARSEIVGDMYLRGCKLLGREPQPNLSAY